MLNSDPHDSRIYLKTSIPAFLKPCPSRGLQTSTDLYFTLKTHTNPQRPGSQISSQVLIDNHTVPASAHTRQKQFQSAALQLWLLTRRSHH